MATFLCKKCAHKTLPISITTFHFQFAVRSFQLFPPMARQSPLLSLGHQKKSEKHSLGSWALREGLENWELRTGTENRELGASVRAAAAAPGSSSSCCSATPPWTVRPLRRTAFRCLVISLLFHFFFYPTPQCATGERKFIKMLIFPAEI